MKFKNIKIALALTLLAATGVANANTADTQTDFIFNDHSLFNNDVAQQVKDHQKLDTDTVLKLVKEPSRTALKDHLGDSKNIRVHEQDSTETWFYGLEIPTNEKTNQKCLVAFTFDIENKQTAPVANIVTFDQKQCENIVVQKLHNH